MLELIEEYLVVINLEEIYAKSRVLLTISHNCCSIYVAFAVKTANEGKSVDLSINYLHPT